MQSLFLVSSDLVEALFLAMRKQLVIPTIDLRMLTLALRHFNPQETCVMIPSFTTAMSRRTLIQSAAALVVPLTLPACGGTRHLSVRRPGRQRRTHQPVSLPHPPRIPTARRDHRQ